MCCCAPVADADTRSSACTSALECHAVLEIILARWGRPAHLVFMFFAFATNILVSAMLILGGAAVTTALTGINIYACATPFLAW